MDYLRKNQDLYFLLIVVAIFMVGCAGQAPDVSTVPVTPTPITTASMTPKAINTALPTVVPTAPETETPAPTITPLPTEEPVDGMEINRASDIDFLSELGTYWVRRNGLLWFKIEPEMGARDWSEAAELDGELRRITEAGMQAILIVRGAPDWALDTAGLQCGPISSEALDDYAAFLQDAVRRYKEPPFNVKYWELGNEPDVDRNQIKPTGPFGCWGDAGAPDYFGGRYYAEMLKVAYPAIKAVDPDARVLLGGLLLDCDPVQPPETAPGSGERKNCASSRFLEGIMENGGGEYFDGVSFHAYDYYQGAEGNYSNGNWHSAWNTTGPVMAAKVNYIRTVLATYGYSRKFLMNTETGLLCGRDGSEADCQTEIFNKTKAYYVIQNNSMARAEGLSANIWYYLRGWRGSGLIDVEQQPLPAYQAYLFNVTILSDTVFVGKVSHWPGVAGYEFHQANE